MIKKISIPIKEFYIEKQVQDDEALYISGNIPEFGKNDLQKSQRMNKFQNQQWYYTLNIQNDNIPLNNEIEYSYYLSSNNNFSIDKYLQISQSLSKINILNKNQYYVNTQNFIQIPIQYQEIIKNGEQVYMQYQFLNQNIYHEYKQPQLQKLIKSKQNNQLWEGVILINKDYYGVIGIQITVGKFYDLYDKQTLQQQLQYNYEIIVLRDNTRNEELMNFVEQNQGRDQKLYKNQQTDKNVKKILQEIQIQNQNIKDKLDMIFFSDQLYESQEIRNEQNYESPLRPLKYGEFPSNITFEQKIKKLYYIVDYLWEQLNGNYVQISNLKFLRQIIDNIILFTTYLQQKEIQTIQPLILISIMEEIININLSVQQPNALNQQCQISSFLIDKKNLQFDKNLYYLWKRLKNNMIQIINSEVYEFATQKYYTTLYDNQTPIQENMEVLELALQYTYFYIADRSRLHGKTTKQGNIIIFLKSIMYDPSDDDKMKIIEAQCLITFMHEFKHFLSRYNYFNLKCSEKKGNWKNKEIIENNFDNIQKDGAQVFEQFLYGHELISYLTIDLAKFLLNQDNWKNHDNFKNKIKQTNQETLALKKEGNIDPEKQYAQKGSQVKFNFEDYGIYEQDGYCGTNMAYCKYTKQEDDEFSD